MATLNQTHVHDLTTLANFTDWAQSVGAALASFGWLQSADTGQVQWTTLSLTAVAVSGTNATYTYTLSAGVALVVGRALNITGMTNSANNGTKVITALGSGTFTVVNASAVAESGSTGSTTLTASVPASNASVYEIWAPGDGLTAFYVRIDYFNQSGTNPTLKVQAGTTTNGTGTLTGFTTAQTLGSATANSGATLYNCLYCGDSSSFAIMLWRDIGGAGNIFFAVDRSRNSSGSATGTYFTLFFDNNGNSSFNWTMQSVVFGVGAAALCSENKWFNTIQGPNQGGSMAFGGNTAITPVFPFVGYYDIPTLVCIQASITDFSELALLSLTFLGSTHSYVFSKNQNFGGANNLGLAMRFE